MRRLRVGIVGAGKIADGHAQEIRKLDCATLVAVCDIEPILAQQLSARYSIPCWYCDFDAMLTEQNLDVVHIATPPRSHLRLTEQAARAGCDVFLEKPLSLDADDGRQLIDVVQRAGRKMTINHWYDFEAPALKLKELLASGELGVPVHVESHCGYDLEDGFGRAVLSDERHWVHQLPGKLFHNVLDHAISRIVGILPDENPEIIARTYTSRQTIDQEWNGMCDELRVMLLAGRISAYVTFCSGARPTGHFLRIYGTRKTVNLDYRLRTLVLEPKQTRPTALGRLLPPFEMGWRFWCEATRNARDFAASRANYFAGFGRLLSLFYQSILSETAVPIPYTEILRVSEIMDAIFAHARAERIA